MNTSKTVTANFQTIVAQKCTLTINTSSSLGTTSPSSPGMYTYDQGTVVNISATPFQGNNFVSWTGDVASPTSASTTVTMNTSKTVTANFEKPATTKYTLTMGSSGLGTTSPSAGSYTYDAGTVVPISATPYTGYNFVSWTGDVASPTSASTTVTMNGNKTVTPNFEKPTVQRYTLTMGVNSPNYGSTSPSVGSYTYDAGTVVTIKAIPVTGYSFWTWTGDVASPKSIETTVTMNANKTVTANFEQGTIPQYTLTMAVNSPNYGSTSPSIGSYTYSSGTVVNISATPVTGYRFSSWTGDVASPTSSSTTVTMNATKTVTANFVQIVINIGMDQLIGKIPAKK
jgi:hypothetical protein